MQLRTAWLWLSVTAVLALTSQGVPIAQQPATGQAAGQGAGRGGGPWLSSAALVILTVIQINTLVIRALASF